MACGSSPAQYCVSPDVLGVAGVAFTVMVCVSAEVLLQCASVICVSIYTPGADPSTILVVLVVVALLYLYDL